MHRNFFGAKLTNKIIPSANEFDDLIRRLEIDLAMANVRLENCKDPNGTYADYMRKRIMVIGERLTRTRNERIKYHGKKIEPKSTVPYRTDSHTPTTSQPKNRLARKRISD